MKKGTKNNEPCILPVYRNNETITKTGKVDLKLANEVYIENKGSTKLTVLGKDLFFGEYISWTNHQGEGEATHLDIKFETNIGSALIITKRYS